MRRFNRLTVSSLAVRGPYTLPGAFILIQWKLADIILRHLNIYYGIWKTQERTRAWRRAKTRPSDVKINAANTRRAQIPHRGENVEKPALATRPKPPKRLARCKPVIPYDKGIFHKTRLP